MLARVGPMRANLGQHLGAHDVVRCDTLPKKLTKFPQKLANVGQTRPMLANSRRALANLTDACQTSTKSAHVRPDLTGWVRVVPRVGHIHAKVWPQSDKHWLGSARLELIVVTLEPTAAELAPSRSNTGERHVGLTGAAHERHMNDAGSNMGGSH